MALNRRGGLVVLVVALMLTGCVDVLQNYDTGYRDHAESLVGKSSDELQIEFGLPDSTEILPDGRKKWTYSTRTERHDMGAIITHNETSYGRYPDDKGKYEFRGVDYVTPEYAPASIRIYACITTFIIGPDDRVESYQFFGDGCFSKKN